MNEWRSAENILCIRLDAMGDVLMTTPAVAFLKNENPDCRITLLTSHEGSLIAPYTELFDDIITYKAPWLKSASKKTDVGDDFEMIRKLKEKKFDGAIIFTVYSQNPLPSALLCYLSEIPLVASYCRENPYSLLSHWLKEEEPQKILRHEVRRHLDLVGDLYSVKAANSALVLKVNKDDEVSLIKKLNDQIEISSSVIIHPGATAASRRYHVDGFAQIADHLASLGKSVLFTGSLSESTIIDNILSKMMVKNNVFDLSGKLSIGEFVALINMGQTLVSNNSGPVHMAAALGTPVVDIYALTNPQHTPWMVKNSTLYQPVSCAYCYKSICPESHNNCIGLISPELIVNETLRLMPFKHSARDEFAINPITLEE